MSSTAYGNTTENGITIDDMVDDNRDVVYPINETYFARLVYARKSLEDEPKAAIAVFNREDIFFALYAKVLPGPYNLYGDGWETSDLFGLELESFKAEFLKYVSNNDLAKF